MRLDFVEICGFRGFREKIRIEFGSGFTVISGRNGAGKSTLCDAIEFALTGSIDKYTVEKSANESLGDYLWWRGKGTPVAHYVTASFKDGEGEQLTVTRTREAGADKTPAQIEAALCFGPRPEGAINQLCKTSIIRDEWIAALSVDLTERDRFELVRSALGPVEGADYGMKAKEVASSAELAHARDEAAYEAARTQLTNGLTQLSEAKDAVARSGDVAAAMATVAAARPDTPSGLLAHMAAGRVALTIRRARLAGAGEAVNQGREVLALRRAFDAPEAAQARDASRQLLARAGAAKDEAENLVVQAQRALTIEEQADAIATSLAALVEHGERLGLHDDRCPLCAAARTTQEFEAGLALARSRIKSLESGVSEARLRLAEAREAARSPIAEYEHAATTWAAIEDEEERLIAREQAHVELFERHALDFRFVQDPDNLEQELNTERDRLIELERALLTLEASQAVSRIATLEDRIAVLRQDVEAAADRVGRSQAAVEAARAIVRAIKRVSGEIIDERLAQISPLLNELYQRLRPHADWRTIEYSIRGDVRRFLSLKVGDGLNPQFVFSSGQRRAAGLAFLLSVHLARAWTRWCTLLLDDPVQHIDDFRALHLVEVLAAFRLDGRQIICAVEDAALADLLCRRMSSTSDQLGRRYDIDVGHEGAAAVVARAEIPPMPTGVLRHGPDLQAVS